MENEEPGSSLQVSFFKSLKDTSPSAVTLRQVYGLITSERYRDSTEKHRYYLDHGQESEAGRIKRGAEFITPSVICQGGRSVKHICGYTGIGMGDLDDLAPGMPRLIIERLRLDPYVLLAYITHSGLGVRLFFLTDITDVRYHNAVYRQGKAYYEQLLSHSFDEHCKNATRTSNLCYDPDAYYNPAAVPMHIGIPEEEDLPAAVRPRKTFHATVDKAAVAVRALLEQQGKRYTEGNYNDYVSSALYLMNDFGVAREMALEWAFEEFPEYNRDALDSIAGSVYVNNDEPGTKALPKDNSGKLSYASIGELEAFIRAQCSLRYNVVLARREICWLDETDFHDITDREENTLWLRAQKANLYSGQNTFLSILKSEFITGYNPLAAYVENLPVWDGQTDYISRVASMVHTSDDTAFALHFRKWFVAFMACILDKEVVNHTILVLIGEQGIYKTTFFNKLLPPELQRYFYTKTNSGQMTKDDNLALSEFALICIEEIDNLRPNELNRLKAMVTMSAVNERAAYDRNKNFRPHIASFCATGNNRLFLTDDTGNRRWLPSLVNFIDDLYHNEIPYEGLYAQALSLYRNGFRYWFSEYEMKELNRHNQRFEEPNIEKELICSHFRLPKPGETGIFISNAEIMERIGGVIKYNLSKTKINRSMRELGYEPIHNRSYRGFRVVLLTSDEIASYRSVGLIRISPEEPELLL